MFANVPCYNLKALHMVVAHDMPAPRTLLSAWQEMRAVWHRQQTDPAYEGYDTPVPAPSKEKTAQALAESNLARKIGEIAPSLE